jgi:CRISPR system Cascade subunit CasA
MTEAKYNLLEEPWIIVTNNQGVEEAVSLADALLRSHEFKSISGEMLAQDIAILRLMLGVLYAIYTRTECYEEVRGENDEEMCISIWENIWKRGYFPEEEILTYLEQYYDRFWLVHPERPFYQVPEIKKGNEIAVKKMIGELVESNNKIQLFPIRSGRGRESLEYDEAARWLLYLNNFDDAAAKQQFKELGKREMSVGYLGRLGLVYVEGDSLFETLLLNFSLINNGEPWGAGEATWEPEISRTEERTQIPIPISGEELFTLQSRRIKLKWEESKATGFLLLGGDQFPIENAFVEPMTMWRFSKGKAGQADAFLPPSNVSRNPSKQLWRDFASLLASTDESRPAGIIRWVGKLAGIVPLSNIRVCTLLIRYGNMQSGVDDVWGDSLSVNHNLLTRLEEGEEGWIYRISNIVKITEELVRELGRLAENIDIATGASDSHGSRIAAQEQAYAALDIPFREWLATIDPDKDNLDMDEECVRWMNRARTIILKQGENLVTQTGTQTFIGRNIIKNKKETYYSASTVYGWFKRNIFKKLKEKGYGKEEN